MKTAQPEPRRRSALLSRDVMATSSAGVAESRSGPRKRAVRWKEPSLLRMTPRSTSAAHGTKSARLCERRRYSARFIIERTSRHQMLRIAEVPPHNVYEGGIALGGPDGGEMAEQPDRAADHPEAEAKTDRGGERAVDDGDNEPGATEQDRFGERAMDGRVEAGGRGILLHHTSAPPPN